MSIEPLLIFIVHIQTVRLDTKLLFLLLNHVLELFIDLLAEFIADSDDVDDNELETSENENDEEANTEESYITEIPSDDEVKAAAEKMHKLTKWAQGVSQEQLQFLLDGGWYNSAIKGYVLLAAEEVGFTDEQKNMLLGGIMKALSNYNKAAAEEKYLVG